MSGGVFARATKFTEKVDCSTDSRAMSKLSTTPNVYSFSCSTRYSDSMNIKVIRFLPLPAALLLVIACGGDAELLPDVTPTIETQTTATSAKPTPPALPTAVPTAATPVPIVLAALCSLDQEASTITCHASGAPKDSQSQLK